MKNIDPISVLIAVIFIIMVICIFIVLNIVNKNKDNNKIYPCSAYKEYSIINVPVSCFKELTQ